MQAPITTPNLVVTNAPPGSDIAPGSNASGKVDNNVNPIATSGVTRYTGAPQSDQSSNQGGSYRGQDGNYYDKGTGQPVSVAPADDAALRSSELANVQGSIDRINSDYATNLTQVQQNNANMQGGTRARDARSGLLGSDFGAANESNAATKAANNITALQTKRDTGLKTIYDSIQKDIDAKQSAFTSQQNKLTTSQVSGLKTNATNYVKNLAKTGGTLDGLTDTEYNHIQQVTGMSDAELHAMFVANIPPNKVLHQSVQNGQYVQVSEDPVTGEIKTNTVPLTGVPDTYTYDAAIQAFIPKGGIDPNKPVHDQIIPYAKAVTPKAPKSTKPIVGAPKGLTQDDIEAGNTKLESAKGSDGYVDPYVYKAMYDHWTQSGGSATAFTKNYPQKNYINPDDNKLLPSYLQTSAKSSGSTTSPKPTAKVIGQVRALHAKNATKAEISSFIKESGYDINDPAFKEIPYQ